MAVTTDIHFKLMKWENREFQQALMERMVTYDAALLGLTEAVNGNTEGLAEVRQMQRRSLSICKCHTSRQRALSRTEYPASRPPSPSVPSR